MNLLKRSPNVNAYGVLWRRSVMLHAVPQNRIAPGCVSSTFPRISLHAQHHDIFLKQSRCPQVSDEYVNTSIQQVGSISMSSHLGGMMSTQRRDGGLFRGARVSIPSIIAVDLLHTKVSALQQRSGVHVVRDCVTYLATLPSASSELDLASVALSHPHPPAQMPTMYCC